MCKRRRKPCVESVLKSYKELPNKRRRLIVLALPESPGKAKEKINLCELCDLERSPAVRDASTGG